jgi:hypothetical protein
MRCVNALLTIAIRLIRLRGDPGSWYDRSYETDDWVRRYHRGCARTM